MISKHFLSALLLLAELSVYGQSKMSEAEQGELQKALAGAGNSPVEFARVLERHLQKYPASPQKDELERALVKAAMEANDKRRILLFGPKVLEKNPEDPLILEKVARLLVASDDKADAQRALEYAAKFEEILRALEKQGPSGRDAGRMTEELDRALSRALAIQARATGNLGKLEEAIVLARRSYSQHPNAESAREAGRWLARAGKTAEAIRAYAEAFTIADPRNTDSDRAKDRAKMSELYVKEKGSEVGLGDIVLEAYDRTSATAGQRLAARRELNPNADQTDPMEFTLTGVSGDSLKLSSLRGKVIVMDFWATWCGPCRVQHPLYDQVKKRFAEEPKVVFVGINTDEDASVVEPFLQANQWSKQVYFEDGLSNLLKVSSIPTTIVMDPQGQIFSRMNGFNPETFVDQLTDRIREALKPAGTK